jgi:hypothetical protein
MTHMQLPVNGLQKQWVNGGDGQNVPFWQKKPHAPLKQPTPGEQHCVVPQGVDPCGHAARHAPWKQMEPAPQHVLLPHGVVPLGHSH